MSWEHWQVKFAKDNCEVLTNAEIAEHLGKTEDTVRGFFRYHAIERTRKKRVITPDEQKKISKFAMYIEVGLQNNASPEKAINGALEFMGGGD